MPRCGECGAPAPAPERILPLGIEKERIFSCGPKPHLVGEFPVSIPYRCPGSHQKVDRGALRFGFIVLVPYQCDAVRFKDWIDTTADLRHRAIEAYVLQLTEEGLI